MKPIDRRNRQLKIARRGAFALLAAVFLPACVTYTYKQQVPIPGSISRERKNAVARDIAADAAGDMIVAELLKILPADQVPLIRGTQISISNNFPAEGPAGDVSLVISATARQKADLDRVRPVVDATRKIVEQEVAARLAFLPLEFRFVRRLPLADSTSVRVRQSTETISVDKTPALTSVDIDSAEDLTTAVRVHLTPTGRVRMAAATAANVGERLAVIVNGVAVSAPRVETRIDSPSVDITGRFTPEETKLLAALLTSK